MFKYLNILEWRKTEDIDTKIQECLKKELIKYIDNKNELKFLVLEKNIKDIKKILGTDYSKITEYDPEEWIKDELYHLDRMVITNRYGDRVELTSEGLYEVIECNVDRYFENWDKSSIYEADNPRRELIKRLNLIGRIEIKNRLKDFLNKVDDISFI